MYAHYVCTCMCMSECVCVRAHMCFLNTEPWPVLTGYSISYVSTLLYNLALCLHDCIYLFIYSIPKIHTQEFVQWI
jgi:hypothetical protein